MTTSQKTVLGAIVLIAALGIVFYAYSSQQMRSDESFLPTDAGDVSDSALERDAAAIDAELSALEEDSIILEESLKAHAEGSSE